jgi:large subunit ribosomal protein L14
MLKARLQKRYLKGTLHRALIIRTKCYYRRAKGVRLRFGENTVVLVTRLIVPVSNRIYGPILNEFCMR